LGRRVEASRAGTTAINGGVVGLAWVIGKMRGKMSRKMSEKTDGDETGGSGCACSAGANGKDCN
jgi:hypothetical protein